MGSWIGFASYVWLLRNAPTSLVATYAYVNPVIAVFLGWLLLHETIGWQTFVGGAVIVLGVLLIVTARPIPRATGEPATAQPPSDTFDEEPDEGAA